MLLEKMVLIDLLDTELPQIFNCKPTGGPVVRMHTSTAEGTGFSPGQRLDPTCKIDDPTCNN